MDHGNMNHGGDMAAAPGMMNVTAMHHHRRMMMHMSFYWGSNGIILFTGWPGFRTGMYILALILVFVLAFLVEWFSHARLIGPGTSSAAAGVVQTLMHAVRVCLAYVLMLAVMSFNVGVLIVAVAGHSFGFFLFGSRVFKKSDGGESRSDLPPMSC